MNLSELKGGVAIITGGGSGLGLALALKAASLQMHVVIADIRLDTAERAVKEVSSKYPGVKGTSFACDVTKKQDVEKLLEYTQREHSGKYIKFVAANAGILSTKSTIISGTYEEWSKTFDVNVLGVFNTLRTFVPVLLKQPCKSAVEITSSIAGVRTGSFGPYGTSKLAALGIAEALVHELKVFHNSNPGNVSVVALCPGLVKTNLLESSRDILNEDDSDLRDDPLSRTSPDLFKRLLPTVGMSSSYCAEMVFEYLESGKFYCILDEESDETEGISKGLARRYNNMISRQFDGKL